MDSKSTQFSDLAFPIEDLWGIIKPRVKRRDPQTLSDLKTYIVQEWNSIPLSLIRNLCSGFIKRVKKVLEMKGSRLEPENIKKKQKVKYINGIFLKYYHRSDMYIMIRKYFY